MGIFSGAALATIIQVPADRPTIQAGIDSARVGDTVLVAEGVYVGEGNMDISCKGKKIFIKGEGQAVIDGGGNPTHDCFLLVNSETDSTIIEGFTIMDFKRAFVLRNSSPTLRNLSIIGNRRILDTPEPPFGSEPKFYACSFSVNDQGIRFLPGYVLPEVGVGDTVANPGTNFHVPINLRLIDAIMGLTIPLQIRGMPNSITMDSVIFEDQIIDSMIIVDDTSFILRRVVQEPPLPESSIVFAGNIYFSADPSTPDTVYNIDTSSLVIGATTYELLFVRSDNDSIIPTFDKGTITISGGAPIRDSAKIGYSNSQEPFANAAPFTFENCTFYNNTGTLIENFGNYDLTTIHNCNFENNDTCISAYYLLTAPGIIIDSCNFLDNELAVTGAGTMTHCLISGGTNGIVSGNDWFEQQFFSATNCIFECLSGAVFQYGEPVYINDCIIRYNYGMIISGYTNEEEYLYYNFANCEIFSNSGGMELCCASVTLNMNNCRYYNNGGPIQYGCSKGNCGGASIVNCTFENNINGALYLGLYANSPYSDDLKIANCTFINSDSVAIMSDMLGVDASLIISNSTVLDNKSDAIRLFYIEGNVQIENTIIAGNNGYGINGDHIFGNILLNCCDIYSNNPDFGAIPYQLGPGGIISEDPHFCPDNQYLYDDSPCAPENNSCGVQIGAFPVGCTCGDANSNGLVNVLDITFIINYLYKHGASPNPIQIADVNSSGMINALDVTYLINYLYKHGPTPNCSN
jgi:hypothetical protein